MSNIRTNTGVTDGVILDANGQPTSVPTKMLTTEEAHVLRAYKKFLQARGLKEAMFCTTCWSGNLMDGMEANVTDGQIMLRCRHMMYFYRGQSF